MFYESNDRLFADEFMQMMKSLKGLNPNSELRNIPLPKELIEEFVITNYDKAIVVGIEDEYYSKLNETEVFLARADQKFTRRKFDYKGKFMKDKSGEIIREEVSKPAGCLGVFSEVNVNVPLKYKNKEEHFEFVDFFDTDKDRKFLYFIPKQYLYKEKQTALVISWRKLPNFYFGVELSMTTGDFINVFVIDYKPNKLRRDYRVLHCKTDVNYDEELQKLFNYWISIGMIFNPSSCELMEEYTKRGKTRNNMAVYQYDGTMDVYEKYDLNKSMAKEELQVFEDGQENYN